MILYEFGYRALDQRHELTEPVLLARDVIVVDVRYVRQPRLRRWSQARLSGELGDRYVHVPELGNLNYRAYRKPIELASPVAGIARLKRIMDRSGLTPLLLCACEEYDGCHRREVVRLLRQALPACGRDLTVERFDPAAVQRDGDDG